MNKKQKIISICAVVLLGASALGGIKYLEDQKYKEEHTYIAPEDLDGTWYMNAAPELTGVAWLNDDSWLMVTQKANPVLEPEYKDNIKYSYQETPPIIGAHTIITSKLDAYAEKSSSSIKYSKNSLVTVYQVEKNKLQKEKQFDLNEIVQKTEKEFTTGGVTKLTQNEEYISFSIIGKAEPYYLRLSDEKVLKESELPKEVLQKEMDHEQQELKLDKGYRIFSATDIQLGNNKNKKLEDYGIMVNLTRPAELLSVYPYGKQKPLLVETYPELQEMYKKKEKATIRFVKNPPAPKKLIDLAYPEDVNPWDNITLYGDNTKSGHNEKIVSLEDFLAKYKS